MDTYCMGKLRNMFLVFMSLRWDYRKETYVSRLLHVFCHTLHQLIPPVIFFLLKCPIIRIHKEYHVYITLNGKKSPPSPFLWTSYCATGVYRFIELVCIYAFSWYFLDVGSCAHSVENNKVLLSFVEAILLGTRFICIVIVAGMLLYKVLSVLQGFLYNKISFAFRQCNVLKGTEVNHLIKV